MTEEMTPLQIRKAEVAQYEANIALYQNILATLPTEWPNDLIKYRNPDDQHKTIESVSKDVDVELLAKLWYADDCAKAIKTETVEMTKAKAILAVLENQ